MSLALERILFMFGLCMVVTPGCGGGGDVASMPSDMKDAVHPDPAQFVSSASLAEAREQHTATRLQSGDVLIVGGERLDFSQIASVELYRAATGQLEKLPDLPLARSNHTATLLQSGRVLIAGGGRANEAVLPSGLEVRSDAWLFDPGTSSWVATAPMTSPRHFHTATRLDGGAVLVVGGADDHSTMQAVLGGVRMAPYGRAIATAELYDPETGTWRQVGSLARARFLHEASLLADGRVLISGGGTEVDEESFATVEIFDPRTETFSAGPTLLGDSRVFHRTAVAGSGRILLAAGKQANTHFLSDAQTLSSSGVGPWMAAGSLSTACTAPALTVLSSGNVLATGGNACSGACRPIDDAQLFIDATSSWQAMPRLSVARTLHSQTRLVDGRVLIVGGFGRDGVLPDVELATP